MMVLPSFLPSFHEIQSHAHERAPDTLASFPDFKAARTMPVRKCKAVRTLSARNIKTENKLLSKILKKKSGRTIPVKNTKRLRAAKIAALSEVTTRALSEWAWRNGGCVERTRFY
jgi:hypothetical protein